MLSLWRRVKMLDVIAVVCSLLVLSVLSLILNTFCIYIIKTSTQFREKPSSILVVNLLLTHIFQAVFVFPLYAGKKLKVEELWDEFFSNGFRVTYLLSFYGACFGVLNISLDRFLATYLLNRYKIYVSFKNVLTVVMVTWVYVLTMCCIPFIPELKSKDVAMNVTTVHNGSGMARVATNSLLNAATAVMNAVNATPASVSVKIFSNVTSDLLYNTTSANDYIMTSTLVNIAPTIKSLKNQLYYYMPQKEWTVFMLFFNAALPLLIIISCYIYVIYRLKRLKVLQPKRNNRGLPLPGDEQMGKENTSNTMKLKEFKKYKQITYLTLVLSTTYTVCWSPSIIYYTILSVCEKKCFVPNWDNSIVEQHVVYVIKYLSFINSLFSPLIYCFHHPEMQRRFSRMKHTFAIQAEPTPPDGYKLSIHHIELNDLHIKDKHLPAYS